MITQFWIRLIEFYQRFVSPYKGFHCAHHARHKNGTCSNAVKDLISDKGLLKALPFIRVRFDECRLAYEQINKSNFRADIPCIDVGCDVGICDCGGDAASSSTRACDCFSYCGDIIDWRRCSKRTKCLIITGMMALVIILAYLLYGRSIDSIEITDIGAQNQSIFKRISQRQSPEVRVLLIVGGKKVYSEIVRLDQTDKAYKLSLNKSLDSFDVDQLQVLDARFSVGKELLVIGQELEVFNDPEQSGQGQRFKYHLKRRWSF